jgi:hypothetical protein
MQPYVPRHEMNCRILQLVIPCSHTLQRSLPDIAIGLMIEHMTELLDSISEKRQTPQRENL